MHRFAKQFAQYCENTLDLRTQSEYGYRSLSACVLDCVYSLRARYYDVTIPLVKRYAAMFMNGDPHASGDTISMLLRRMDERGHKAFADDVLINHQKLGGKKQIPKEEVCYQLARYLQALHIETIEDFQNFESQEILEIVMLAGDPKRCKPDVHIHHCIRDACGCDVSDAECQELFTDAVELLCVKFPDLTVRGLDGIVWRAYQIRA